MGVHGRARGAKSWLQTKGADDSWVRAMAVKWGTWSTGYGLKIEAKTLPLGWM